MKTIRWPFLGAAPLFALLTAFGGFSEAFTVKLDLHSLAEENPPHPAKALFQATRGQFRYAYPRGRKPTWDQNPDFADVVSKEPRKYETESPFRGVLVFGATLIGFVLDSTNLNDQGFDVALLDLDADGDLTDETPVQAEPAGPSSGAGAYRLSRTFPPIRFPVRVGDATQEYSIFLEATRYVSDGEFQSGLLQTISAVYRRGKFTLDGEEYEVVLIDDNANGTFNDEATVNPPLQSAENLDFPVYLPPGDFIILDPKPSKKTRQPGSAIGADGLFVLSKLLPIDGTFYRLSVSGVGDEILLEPSELPTGTLESEAPSYKVQLLHPEMGVIKVSGANGKGAKLPVGSWRLCDYEARPNDYDPEKPTYVRAGATLGSPTVEIRENAVAKAEFGSSYHASVTTFMRGQTQEQAIPHLTLKIKGAMNEICSDVKINGKLPAKPNFIIATAEGKIIDRGRFEYG